MVQRAQVLANILQNLRIGLEGRTCCVLQPGQDTGRVGNLTDVFEPGDGNFLVDRREEPIGADDGVGGGGGAVDSDVAARGEGEDGRGEGYVVARHDRLVEV